MKRKHWILVMLVVVICAAGVLVLIGDLESDKTGKEREENSNIKEESIPDDNSSDETEIILDYKENQNQTENSTNADDTDKDNTVTDNITTDSDKQSGENQQEDAGGKDNEEVIENLEPIELPRVPYKGEN